MMAEAVGKATGRPGICFVTRGPGATNAAPGIHIARQDSTPMILFVGQVARDMREREAFQELDYRAVFGSIAKWATEIDDPARMPELVSRAFYTATNGRPGPVVIALPEDMLTERVDARGRAAVRAGRDLAGRGRDGRSCAQLLARPRAPIMLLGGSRWSEAACDRAAALRRTLRAAGGDHVPPRASFRCAASLLCGRSRHRAQSEAARARQGAPTLSCWSAAGSANCRRSATRCSTFRRRSMTLVHVHPGAEELGRVYRPHLAINATPTAFAAALERLAPPNDIRWRGETEAAHADYPRLDRQADRAVPGAVNLGEIVVWLRDKLPADAIVTATAPAIFRSGCIASIRYRPLRHADSRRRRARWAMACRRRSR